MSDQTDHIFVGDLLLDFEEVVREGHDLGFAEYAAVVLETFGEAELVDEIVADELDVEHVAVVVVDALFHLDFGCAELFDLLLRYRYRCHYFFVTTV